MSEQTRVSDMGDDRAQIECDGGPYCQATEHVHGCFAERPPRLSAAGKAQAEVESLRQQLGGAVEVLNDLVERQHDYPTDLSHDHEWFEAFEKAKTTLERLGGR